MINALQHTTIIHNHEFVDLIRDHRYWKYSQDEQVYGFSSQSSNMSNKSIDLVAYLYLRKRDKNGYLILQDPSSVKSVYGSIVLYLDSHKLEYLHYDALAEQLHFAHPEHGTVMFSKTNEH
jgi:predicted lactoylglutathione lyase